MISLNSYVITNFGLVHPSQSVESKFTWGGPQLGVKLNNEIYAVKITLNMFKNFFCNFNMGQYRDFDIKQFLVLLNRRSSHVNKHLSVPLCPNPFVRHAKLLYWPVTWSCLLIKDLRHLTWIVKYFIDCLMECVVTVRKIV